jgi:cell division protein FtsW
VLQYFLPFFDKSVRNWSLEARLLRWLTYIWLLLGLVVLFSASYALTGNILRQVVWVWLGMIALNVIVRSPLRYFLAFAPWILLLLLGLIFATLLPCIGATVNGASRWVKLGPVILQPSELIKPFLILQSARIFGNWERLPPRQRLQWLGIFALLLVFILLQPNLSTTALCGITLWLLALAGGVPLRWLGATALGGLLLAAFSVSQREYQLRRILSFLNPWGDPQGDGYQLIQSLLAVGSGGTWGTGYGLSQQKLFYLPFADTDFIFAVFAEEFGFVGGLLLLALLLGYATLALMVAFKCRHPVKRLIAIGVMILLVGQSLLNIGVATGALPTTGLPLPLFSYGGSSSLASLFLAGLLIRVARESSEANVVALKQGKRIDLNI